MAAPPATLNANLDSKSTPSEFLAASSKKIGFIGLGNMGYLMARNMASRGRANFPDLPAILVWNRTDAKSKQLLNEVGHDNALIAQDPEQIVNDCGIIITSLANDDVVRAVYQRLANTLKASPSSRFLLVGQPISPTEQPTSTREDLCGDEHGKDLLSSKSAYH